MGFLADVPGSPPSHFMPSNNNPNSDEDDDDDNNDGHNFSDSPHDIYEDTDDESEIDYEVPSLDDIIPWSPSAHRKPPPLVEVLDPVHNPDQSINVEFLRNALRSHCSKDGVLRDVTVQSHTYRPLETPDISQRNRLTEVDVEALVEDRPETFHMVIKTLSPATKELAARDLFDRREVGLYTEILGDINIFQRQQIPDAEEYILVPSSKCFFTRYVAPCEETDSDQDQNVESVVVMENVKYLGYTQTRITEGLSMEQVLSVAEGVARLHGLSLAMKERSGIPLQKSYPYLLCMRETAKCAAELFERNVDPILNLLKRLGAKSIHEKLSGLRPYLCDFIEALATPEEPVSVLAHMNLWAHNILFKGDQCAIVDWQMITCSRPTFDLAFLLASSVKTVVRRQYTTLFLEHYYKHFTMYADRYGLNIERHLDYTMRSLRRDFRCSQLLALVFCIAKANDILTTREAEYQLIDYMHDLDDQNVINLDVMNLETPDDSDDPDNPGGPRRPRRRPSAHDVDHICGLFAVYDVPY